MVICSSDVEHKTDSVILTLAKLVKRLVKLNKEFMLSTGVTHSTTPFVPLVVGEKSVL